MPKFYTSVGVTSNVDGDIIADVPSGVDWVGQTDGSEYIVVTSTAIPGTSRTNDNQVKASARNIIRNGGNFSEDDPISLWKVPGV